MADRTTRTVVWRRVGSFIHLPAIGVRRSTHPMAAINPADLDAALGEGPQQIMTAANIARRFKRSPHPEPATHLFTVGQAVRLKNGFSRSGDIYLITAKLPPIGDLPQYRLRNDNEKFERMATESDLEAVRTSRAEGDRLIEKSFGPGPGT